MAIQQHSARSRQTVLRVAVVAIRKASQHVRGLLPSVICPLNLREVVFRAVGGQYDPSQLCCLARRKVAVTQTDAMYA